VGHADADWANRTALPTVNNTVRAAIGQFGLTNTRAHLARLLHASQPSACASPQACRCSRIIDGERLYGLVGLRVIPDQLRRDPARGLERVESPWSYNEKPAGQIALACGFTRGGGGGNRTRVLQRRPKTSPGAVC
jgi:hypothetical protein